VTRKLSNIVVLCACVLGMSAALVGQSSSAGRGIQGYLDPRTGAFHPIPAVAEPDAEPPATVTYGGKLVFKFTITVAATISATAKIACSVDASVTDTNGASFNFFDESASALATRSGTTATCTVNIPYSWKLANGGTDMVAMTYVISAPSEITVATDAYPNRLSSASLTSIKIPLNGATTTTNISAKF
jgi:hypothetical protein